MKANGGSSPATYFGRQMNKDRVAHGWSLREFSARTGIDFTTLSRIENGKRPPNEKVALACDAVFPDRRGWFSDYYEESKSWVPAGFRSWAEYEEVARLLRDWWPSVVSGLLQTEDYARAVLETSPGATDEIVTARLTARMERQRRLFARDALLWFVIDEPALHRFVGSAEVMAGQMHRLAEVASMPNVTLQVLPPVAHPAGASGFIVTENAAYAEHVAGGYVYTDDETVTSLLRLFTSIQRESYRASETLRMIERLGETWAAGESPLTQTPTAGRA